MKANVIAKNYGCLTPEERFRLILAASGRGDESERDRLTSAGLRITLSMSDHAPFAHAFDELALLTFIELLEDATRYLDSFSRGAACDESADQHEAEAEAQSPEDDSGPRPAWQRFLDVSLAAGYMLRAKADAWELFCEELNVPHYLMWQELPGFDRLQRALALAEEAAFTHEGMLRWLNAVRPAGEPELTEFPLTAERQAAAMKRIFRQRASWHGG